MVDLYGRSAQRVDNVDNNKSTSHSELPIRYHLLPNSQPTQEKVARDYGMTLSAKSQRSTFEAKRVGRYIDTSDDEMDMFSVEETPPKRIKKTRATSHPKASASSRALQDVEPSTQHGVPRLDHTPKVRPKPTPLYVQDQASITPRSKARAEFPVSPISPSSNREDDENLEQANGRGTKGKGKEKGNVKGKGTTVRKGKSKSTFPMDLPTPRPARRTRKPAPWPMNNVTPPPLSSVPSTSRAPSTLSYNDISSSSGSEDELTMKKDEEILTRGGIRPFPMRIVRSGRNGNVRELDGSAEKKHTKRPEVNWLCVYFSGFHL